MSSESRNSENGTGAEIVSVVEPISSVASSQNTPSKSTAHINPVIASLANTIASRPATTVPVVVKSEHESKAIPHMPGVVASSTLPSSGTSNVALADKVKKPKPPPAPTPAASSSSSAPVAMPVIDQYNSLNAMLSQVDHYIEAMDVKDAVLKIMKRIVPPTVSIDLDARDLVLDCMLEFASSLSNEAVIAAAQKGERVVEGKHFEHAVTVLGYEDYVKPITTFNMKRQEHINKGCKSCGGKLEPFRKRAPAGGTKSKAKTKIETCSKGDGEPSETNTSTSNPQRSRTQQAGWEQLDETTLSIFAERLKAALTKSNPNEDLKSMSKDLNISMKLLKQKLAE